jgi:hypothetical protein
MNTKEEMKGTNKESNKGKNENQRKETRKKIMESYVILSLGYFLVSEMEAQNPRPILGPTKLQIIRYISGAGPDRSYPLSGAGGLMEQAPLNPAHRASTSHV